MSGSIHSFADIAVRQSEPDLTGCRKVELGANSEKMSYRGGGGER